MIKVIRICDICQSEHQQQIDEFAKTFNMDVSYHINFICANCFLSIHKLMDIADKISNGAGIGCINNIVSCLLELQNVEKAKSIYEENQKKIDYYPELKEWFDSHFNK